MAPQINYRRLKTWSPRTTAPFYVDNFSATIVSAGSPTGYRPNLHGFTLNVGGFIIHGSPNQRRFF
jgi:hypothetical protein